MTLEDAYDVQRRWADARIAGGAGAQRPEPDRGDTEREEDRGGRAGDENGSAVHSGPRHRHAVVRRSHHHQMFDDRVIVRQNFHLFVNIEPRDQTAGRMRQHIDVPGVERAADVIDVFI